MCIVLFTTAHPDYALILIDNRDEYILRPTSRPHWWTHPSGSAVLSSRDLQRAEQGTWLGLTRDGLLAVLTNYREAAQPDPQHPVCGVRSRGAMVTSWLGGVANDGVMKGVDRLVAGGGVKGVGGFSMVCGKLRRKTEGIAIVSNRAGDAADVPLVGRERGEVWGLSNTVFDTAKEWPKVETGKRLLKTAVEEAVSNKSEPGALISSLFTVLDNDTLPQRGDMGFMEYIEQLRHSVFIPPIGDKAHREAMQEASARGKAEWAAAKTLRGEQRPDPESEAESGSEREAGRMKKGSEGFDTGMYGTQRQTVVLVDWDGNVTMVERALWDMNGNEIPRGEADVTFRFQIDGWNESPAEGI